MRASGIVPGLAAVLLAVVCVVPALARDAALEAAPAPAPGFGAFASAVSPCPREALASMLRSAVAPGDVGAALALERETLRLCAARQKLALEVLGLEEKLRGLVPAALPPEPAPAPEPPPARAPEPPPAPAPVVEAPPPAKPSFTWFTVYGRVDALVAGVSDGRAVWHVREGDALPGGAVVEAIVSAPPAVHVRGAAASPLPFRARPQ